jgi:hypothetical protein
LQENLLKIRLAEEKNLKREREASIFLLFLAFFLNNEPTNTALY